MPKISGFTIVRNAVKLMFPLEASIRSLLTVCDEVVVNVGRSEDETLEVVRGIGDPRIRIIETVWATDKQNYVLGDETLRAMRACTHPWGIYIQADEVLHERGAEELRRVIQAVDADPVVEGLLVKYHHFYGGFDVVATHRRWYRREVRAVRLDPALDIRPYQGAQGFRVGPEHRKIRARLTTAEMFHYGWCRPTAALRAKRENDKVMYPWRPHSDDIPLLRWIPGLKPFPGQHPAVAAPYVARYRDQIHPVGPRFWTWKFARIYASGWVEKLTGWRPFEFRNYRIV
ncbi:MAG TPA: hypothetical protein VFS07_07295 [Gemmatimonadales bacterium]|jgi:hypothetical protein|nr:hypothetical protein [Gemmatimonadales bacterium]